MTQALLLLSMLGLAAWTSVGPGTVTRGRFDCTGAAGQSWKSQKLLNRVMLRYGDTPASGRMPRNPPCNRRSAAES
jgi:hypothetical protein